MIGTIEKGKEKTLLERFTWKMNNRPGNTLDNPQPRLRNAAGELLGDDSCGWAHYSGADLLDAVMPPHDWGPWHLDTATCVLQTTRGFIYQVDLERCLDAAAILRHVAHITQKRQLDNAGLGGLIRALDDVLGLRQNLCPSGAKLTKTRVRELAVQAQEARQQSLDIYSEDQP